jgi:hypothetical protein
MIARPEAPALEPLLEQLGLRQAAAVLPDWQDRAASQELSYADFLHGLLEEESVARANAATQKRLRQAGFPYAATIEQFDFRFRPELKRQVVLRLPGSHLRRASSDAGTYRATRPGQDDAGDLYRHQAHPARRSSWPAGSSSEPMVCTRSSPEKVGAVAYAWHEAKQGYELEPIAIHQNLKPARRCGHQRVGGGLQLGWASIHWLRASRRVALAGRRRTASRASVSTSVAGAVVTACSARFAATTVMRLSGPARGGRVARYHACGMWRFS